MIYTQALAVETNLVSCHSSSNIKSSALSSRIFTKLCFEINVESTQLSLHTEIRWMSKGKVLYEVNEELAVFFLRKNEIQRLTQPRREELNPVAYLADMFGSLNQLNTQTHFRVALTVQAVVIR